MNREVVYVLIHSPLVGPLTWQLVCQALIKQNLQVRVPILFDDPNSTRPYWQQHVEAVLQSLIQIPTDQKLVLVAHSGAGALLPVIRAALPHSISTHIFVDAGIPRDGLSRIELMKLEDPQWGEQFHQALLLGVQFPTWTEGDLREIIPDHELRRKMVAEIRPRSLPYFAEPIPVFQGWPDAPCAYIKFSESYKWDVLQAKQAGWLVHELNVGHFHTLVEPRLVTDLIVNSVQKLLDSPNSQ
jgi:hypothetical protein